MASLGTCPNDGDRIIGQDKLDAFFGDDEIFFGSLPVHLARVPGRAKAYKLGEFEADTERDADGKPFRTLARRSPIPHPSDSGPDVVVPCMPCLDKVRKQAEAKTDPNSHNLDSHPDPSDPVALWPEQLRFPLIKVKTSTKKNKLKAYASGCRSACVKVDGSWYRLKGSGNNDDGFLVKTSESILRLGGSKVTTRQIRGCAFEHTAICENHYSAILENKLSPSGIIGTNTSMGYYLYDGDSELPLGRDHPSFQTACIVERTRGDRRFGTHVLAGITLLLPELLDIRKLDTEAMRSAFPEAHRKNGGDLGRLGPVFLFDDSAELGILPTSGLFGSLQIYCASKFMTRQCQGKERTKAWAEVKDKIANWNIRDTSSCGSSKNDSELLPSDREVANTLRLVLNSRLVGSVTSLSSMINEFTGVEYEEHREISEGILGSWIDGDYMGDVNPKDAAMRLLQKWDLKTCDGFKAGPPLDDLDPSVLFPVIPSSYLAQDPHSLLAEAESAPNPDVLPCQYFRDVNTGKEGQKNADPRWQVAWRTACNELNDAISCLKNSKGRANKSGRQSILVYLYNRLGFECGRFAKMLHQDCNTSWGTYQDAICHESGWHCNAHANNMAVLSPGHSPDSYLSYLDLDMAFDNETYVDINPRSRSYGKVGQDPAEFGMLLAFENVNFMEVIAGNDNSTGVPPIAQKAIREFPLDIKLAREVLHDMMMQGYLAAYYAGRTETNSSYFLHAFDPCLHAAGMAVIKLAIIKQADYLA